MWCYFRQRPENRGFVKPCVQGLQPALGQAIASTQDDRRKRIDGMEPHIHACPCYFQRLASPVVSPLQSDGSAPCEPEGPIGINGVKVKPPAHAGCTDMPEDGVNGRAWFQSSPQRQQRVRALTFLVGFPGNSLVLHFRSRGRTAQRAGDVPGDHSLLDLPAGQHASAMAAPPRSARPRWRRGTSTYLAPRGRLGRQRAAPFAGRSPHSQGRAAVWRGCQPAI